MATPTANLVPTEVVGFPADTFTASLIFGTKWGNGGLGTGVVLTYSVPEGPDTAYDPNSYSPTDPTRNEWEYGNGFTALDATQQLNFEDALASWSNVADIQFNEVGDDGSVVGEIRVAFSELVDFYGAGAWAYLPENAPYAGDVFINHLYIPEDFDEGTWYFNTLIHELGHTLGLKHPFDEDGSEVVLSTEFDNIFYTVMTYTDDPSGNNFFIDRYPDTPMVIDILAIQYLYGPNTTFQAGDNDYVFDESALYFETIWDAGGDDTIEHNGSTGVTIDLRPGKYSTLGQPIVFTDGYGGPIAYTDPRTVWIAYGTDIENAVGGAGNDQLIGNDLNNDLYGGDGADLIYGTAGDAHIWGELGDDMFFGGAGNDVLDGGDGTDTAAFWDAASGVTVNLAVSGVQDTGGADTDTLSDVENLVGTDFDDLLIGDGGNNILAGRAGNDELYGGSGNDVLDGGAGNDQVIGGAGNDLVYGEAGNDTFYGDAGDDSLWGGAGNDYFYNSSASPGTDTLEGGTGNDVYILQPGDTVIENVNGGIHDHVGADFSLTLFTNVEWLTFLGSDNLNGVGNSSDNILFGNDGDNLFLGLGGIDVLWGGEGNDTLYGGNGNDQVEGREGNNFLWGGDGSDLLNSMPGSADIMRGDSGDDVYVFQLEDTIIEASDGGRDEIIVELSMTLSGNIEDLTLMGSDNLNGTGNSVNNSLTGNNGNNVLLGLQGHDGLIGNGGNDSLYGAEGNDGLVGGAGNDVLYGGDGNDALDGGSGSDFLWGGEGNDFLSNELGSVDVMRGGAGDDRYSIQFGDSVLEAVDGGVDLVNATFSLTLFDNVETLGLGGSENLTGTGNALDNSLSGNQGNNLLSGLAGNDRISGNEGNDTLYGGSGNDQLIGEDGDDYLWGGDGDNSLLGESGADILFGGTGSDQMSGGEGNDFLDGGGGNDIATAEDGNDILVYHSSDIFTIHGGLGTDTLRLSSGVSTIDLNGLAGTMIFGIEIIDLAGTNSLVLTSAQLGDLSTETDTLRISGGADDEVIAAGTWLIGATVTVDGQDYVTYQSAGTTALIQTGILFTAELDDWNLDDPGDPDAGPVDEDGGMGDDDLDGSAFDDRIAGLGGDDHVNGGAGNDTLIGNGGADMLNGGAGYDTLRGGGGNDVLQGGADDDILKGGGGVDVLDGGEGSDTYVLATGDVSTDTYQDSGTGVDNLDRINASALSVLHLTDQFSHAGSGIEIIIGANTGTQIAGGNGPVNWDFTDITLEHISVLMGTGGGDVMIGSAGDDHILGRDEHDQLHGGVGNDVLTGGKGHDTLDGDAGNDVLKGGQGADSLRGGAGRDILTGGSSTDIFWFDTALGAAKADVVTDFEESDYLILTMSIFPALTIGADDILDAAQFRANRNGIAKDADDRILYNTETGALYYDADGNGDGVAIKFAVLEGAPELTVGQIDLLPG